MFDRSDARRPAQVNACFEGGASRRDEIVAALRQAGLNDSQITVIDRPDPDDTKVATSELGFFDRLKEMFSGDKDREQETHRYDLLILVHLGDEVALAGPVQEVFKRFDAARVNFYPVAEAEMHVLGGGAPNDQDKDMAGTHDREKNTLAATAPAGTTASATTTARDRNVEVEAGSLELEETTQIVTSAGTAEKVEPAEETVYRAEAPPPIIEEPGQPAAIVPPHEHRPRS